jgi:LmbE family N-acetylglucosaminyl deacetylase
MQYRYLSKVEKGSYQFLLHKIEKSTDIDFIEKVWQLDHFREVLIPRPIPLSELKKILVLAPHQDDEAIGCGGTLLNLAEQGASITTVFLTNGAELTDPETSVAIRHKEAINATRTYSGKAEFLDIDNISMDILEEHTEKLVGLLNERWDAVFTVWPIDQPPKHRVCAYFVGQCLSKSSYNGIIYYYAVHTDLLPNFYTDISKHINAKQELIRCYPSQLKAQAYDHLSHGMDAWRSRFLKSSPDKRYVEVFMGIPKKAYIDFMEVFDISDPQKLFKGNENCIRSFKKLRGQH